MVSENGGNGVVKLLPCPFCEGPPSLIVQNGYYPYGEAPLKDDYGDDGLWVKGFVFCHECGAQSPDHEDHVYGRGCYAEVQGEAVKLWNRRDNRHRDLYDSSESRGLAFHPRADEPA